MFGKRYSCIVIPTEVEGSFLHTGIASYVRQRKRGNLPWKEQERAECKEDFSLRSKWRYGGMGLFQVAYNGHVWKVLFPYRHPERSRGIFLAHRYSAVCETAGKGNPSVKGARKSRVRGRFLAALEMTVWGMGLFHVAYNEYVWKTLFLYRHPDRSGGIFFAYWYSVLCVTAENGKPFAKGTRKNKVQGRFLDCARNDGMGEWGYFTQRTTNMFGKDYSCIVIPSEAEGSFWHTGIASYVRQQGRGILPWKEQERAECKEDFSTALEMTVGKAADSMNLRF